MNALEFCFWLKTKLDSTHSNILNKSQIKEINQQLEKVFSESTQQLNKNPNYDPCFPNRANNPFPLSPATPVPNPLIVTCNKDKKTYKNNISL